MRKLSLLFIGLMTTAAACGGGSSGPPPETDDDFPLMPPPGLAPTPPMGWNSWNKFACNINEMFVKQIAQAMVDSGMQDAGYQYVNIDDCWSLAARDANGALQPDPTHFPNGIGPVADFVHGLGLKLGLYGDRGTETCGHRAGSQDHEAQDATTLASWGVDYLKYDNCPDPGPNPGPIIEPRYETMRAALDAAGQAANRPIVFSICAWSFYEWANRLGQLQRTTTDIKNTWAPDPSSTETGSILTSLKTNLPLAAYGGPNHWNDPDMLEVGNSDNGAGPVTDVENQSHFSLWAIAAAPLIAGNDLRNMSPATKAILTNKEIIALDQDGFGLQGVQVKVAGEQSVWAKPLNANGARSVVLLNEAADAADITFSLTDIGLGTGTAKVRDLQAQADRGSFNGTTTINVASHGTATLKIVGNEPPRPRGMAYLSDMLPIYAANGLGPIERDTSNGASDPGDGKPLSIRGTAFTKGIGLSAPSAIIYRLGGKCTSFSAQVGVDDSSTSGAGTVRFQVIADGDMLFDSQNVSGTTPAMAVNVDLTGKRRLKLLVTNADDGNSLDRAAWADAKVECAP
jgi:alpha-galactosidase